MGVLSVLLKKKVLSVLLFKRVLSDGSRNPTCLFTFSKGGSNCLSVAINEESGNQLDGKQTVGLCSL